MSRTARKKSSSGIYHIILRGINRQNIFEDEKDRQRFIETITRFKRETDFEVYAYCLMNNHVHLLVKENKIDLSKIIKKIGTSYVYYFNLKYERNGHLFQDRYKSEAVETDDYLYTVVRYIHQNPAKAGISSLENYKWSSYKNYIYNPGPVSTDFFLRMFAGQKEDAVKKYISYMTQQNNDKCLEIADNQTKLTDEKASEYIKQIGNLATISDIQKLDIISRNQILRKAKEIKGISILQISRITGFNRIIISLA